MNKQIKRKPYQTDMSDKEWEKIESQLPKRKTKRGRKLKHSFRETLNAIFMLYVQAAHGECCRMIFRRGKQYITTSASGDAVEYGRVLMQLCAPN